MDKRLLDKLKFECKTVLENNMRFHDYAHALEVLDNTKKILKNEKGDMDILYTAALFHDLSNKNGKDEGVDGAKIARNILVKIPEFPQNKIKDVKRIIKSISADAVENDEIIINEADRMALFSKQSIVRGFMIYGQRGMQPQEAIKDFLELIEKKYKRFKLKSAKKLVEKDYIYIKKFLSDLIS